MSSPPVTVYTLTYNEARQIRAVLEGVKLPTKSVSLPDELVRFAGLERESQAIPSFSASGAGQLRNPAIKRWRELKGVFGPAPSQ